MAGVLDGRHRLRACYERKVEAKFKTTTVDPWVYAHSANIARRHLTVGQKATFGLAWMEDEKAKAKERQGTRTDLGNIPQGFAESEKGESREIVAAKLGISGFSVSKAEKVAEQSPELIPKLASGEVSLDAAYKEARKHEKQMAQHPIPEAPKPAPKSPAPQLRIALVGFLLLLRQIGGPQFAIPPSHLVVDFFADLAVVGIAVVLVVAVVWEVAHRQLRELTIILHHVTVAQRGERSGQTRLVPLNRQFQQMRVALGFKTWNEQR